MSVKRALTVFSCCETAKRITLQHCHPYIGLSCNSCLFFFFLFFNIELIYDLGNDVAISMDEGCVSTRTLESEESGNVVKTVRRTFSKVKMHIFFSPIWPEIHAKLG